MRISVNQDGPVVVVEVGGTRVVVEGAAAVEEFFEAVEEARHEYEIGLEMRDMAEDGFDA